jgi:outer membrane receptor protein involved in Fe transport
MTVRFAGVALLSGLLLGVPVPSATAEQAAQATARKVRVTGIVRDDSNNITLPGVPVEVVGQNNIVYTDVDGRYVLDLDPGKYELKVSMDGYQERLVSFEVAAGSRPMDIDVGMAMAGFRETVVVTGDAPVDALTSSAEVMIAERKNAPVIADNLGAQDMKRNADSDAAGAMSRVTGLSVVDNQYVYVRGLGERYSNTLLAGATLPTTEPDKKVVPMDMFPAALLDNVSVTKSYMPDKSAEFAGGLVQITPIKFPSRPVISLGYGFSANTITTGESIPLSPLGNRDWLGYDDGARALPSVFPDGKIVRQGIYTPDVGFSQAQSADFGRALENRWSPATADGAPGQNWGAVFGNRFGKFGVVASVTQSYREQYVEEQRAFYRIGDDGDLEAVSDYNMQYGTQRAQLGAVANLSYQSSSNNRLTLENFYSHSGRDEGRYFEGPNTENQFYYRNYRLQFIEEGLLSNSLSGEHFFQNLANSRFDWRASYAQANRDEPDLRETLYQANQVRDASGNFVPVGNFLLADESQSGFRMFNELDDQTLDVAANWSVFKSSGGRPTQYKFGVNVIDRDRDFSSRRFRFIPNVATSGGAIGVNLALPPEELFTSQNIGPRWRFNEETRPVDAYTGTYTTLAAYGMVDVALSPRSRLIAGLRVEDFDQEVVTFDPFGLFERTTTAENRNTDLFPSINWVQSVAANQNIRLSYSSTVNRPEFRELAQFEFTDVVGSRAVQGNPDLNRALIQNVDARWELFPGGRSVIAASGFYKYFNDPIERVVIAGAQPIVTFQNADKARNFGVELEAAYDVGAGFFLNANYTWVDSEITLSPEQRTVQTSQTRSLAGQSNNLFNLTAEYAIKGFSARLLFNYFDDRISDVGANQAPDTIENGRETVDVVFVQRFGQKLNFRFSIENVTDADWLFTQGNRTQRSFQLGRTFGFSLGYDVF